MPYTQRLDRTLEPELYLTLAIYGQIPGFQSTLRTFYSQIRHRDFRGELELLKLFYDSNDGVIDFLIRNGVGERVRKLLTSLQDRQRQVVALRFGFQDGTVYTLEEAGKLTPRERFRRFVEFNTYLSESVSGERVRQIEVKALRRLRHPSRSRELRQYLESLAESQNST